MREIKFRAKALVNDNHAGIKKGDWVYGCYIETRVDAPCMVWGDGEQIEIDRKTLGQFTNKHDITGEPIYEGDKVIDTDSGGESFDGLSSGSELGELTGFVEFDDDGFVVNIDGSSTYENLCDYDWGITGTIHDTQEKAA